LHHTRIFPYFKEQCKLILYLFLLQTLNRQLNLHLKLSF